MTRSFHVFAAAVLLAVGGGVGAQAPVPEIAFDSVDLLKTPNECRNRFICPPTYFAPAAVDGFCGLRMIFCARQAEISDT